MAFSRSVLFLLLLLSGNELFAQVIPAEPDRSSIAGFRLEYTFLNEDEPVKVFLLSASEGHEIVKFNGAIDVDVNGESRAVIFTDGLGRFNFGEPNRLYLIKLHAERPFYKLFYYQPDHSGSPVKQIPFWLSVLPPLLAIFLALIFREVIISLFAGIWLGAYFVKGMGINAILPALFDVVDHYTIHALTDSSKASIILFSILIGGMVAIISRNGGMAGVVNRLSRFANSAASSQLITWFIGIAIFFDDYANTLIVGNTMRPVTDRYRVSREKLAYIVDSTAAPVAAIAFFTTWIGAELGYIEGALEARNIDTSAYAIFFNSLAYSYYPVLTLLFIFFLIRWQKDYGPMYDAELRARETGQVYLSSLEAKEAVEDDVNRKLQPKPGIKENGWFAFLPIIVLVGTVVYGLMFYPGSGPTWRGQGSFLIKLQRVIGDSDSYQALLWGSSAGVFVAILMSVAGKKLSIRETLESLMNGFKTMLTAIVILILAWSLAQITEEMHTADFLVSVIPESLSVYWFPLITFILAAIVSFATGSSWGTMAILYPIALPTTYDLSVQSGLSPDQWWPIMYNVTSVVLAGSVFGDHCSPISDTTILSSLASHCDHIEHVRTQLPYAITVGLISIFVGGVLFAVHVPWWLGYAIGLGLVLTALYRFGKKIPEVKTDNRSPG